MLEEENYGNYFEGGKGHVLDRKGHNYLKSLCRKKQEDTYMKGICICGGKRRQMSCCEGSRGMGNRC